MADEHEKMAIEIVRRLWPYNQIEGELARQNRRVAELRIASELREVSRKAQEQMRERAAKECECRVSEPVVDPESVRIARRIRALDVGVCEPCALFKCVSGACECSCHEGSSDLEPGTLADVFSRGEMKDRSR